MKLASENPTSAVGLTDHGRIEVGLKADSVLMEEAADYPHIRAVLGQGHPIYWDAYGTTFAIDGAGRYIMLQYIEQYFGEYHKVTLATKQLGEQA